MRQLALVALAAMIAGRVAAQSTIVGLSTVTGSIAYVDTHDGNTKIMFAADGGGLVPFQNTQQGPGTVVMDGIGGTSGVLAQDTAGVALQPGSQVSVSCYVDPNTGLCANVQSVNTQFRAKPVTATLPLVTVRLLVMLLDYSPCNLPLDLDEAAIRTIYLGPAGDGSGGMAQKWNQCSYGKFKLSVPDFKVIKIKPPCTLVQSCSWWTISNDADNTAKAITNIPGFSFTNFTHYTYVLPPGMQQYCGWAGLALLPGRQTWLQSGSYGVRRWATIMQETLHNFGLWHSWQNGIEYADYSTSMGRGDACPNAPELSRLTWANPVSNAGGINSAALPTGVASSFVLPATYLTGDANYIRVLPDWTPLYNTASGRNLYMAVRVAKSGDATIATSYTPKLNVHEVIAIPDNAFPSSPYTDRRISFIAGVPSMTQVSLTAYNLVVYGGAWVGTDIMRIFICRYVTSAAECPPLSSLEKNGPVSSPPPPPPPFLRPPPPRPPFSPPPRPPSPPPPRSSPPPPPPPLSSPPRPPPSPPPPRPSPKSPPPPPPRKPPPPSPKPPSPIKASPPPPSPKPSPPPRPPPPSPKPPSHPPPVPPRPSSPPPHPRRPARRPPPRNNLPPIAGTGKSPALATDSESPPPEYDPPEPDYMAPPQGPPPMDGGDDDSSDEDKRKDGNGKDGNGKDGNGNNGKGNNGKGN